MIANVLVRGALAALGQLQTPATITRGDRLSEEFRQSEQDYWGLSNRAVLAGSCRPGLSGLPLTWPAKAR